MTAVARGEPIGEADKGGRSGHRPVEHGGNKKPLSSINAEAYQPRGAVLKLMVESSTCSVNTAPAGASIRKVGTI